MSRWRVLAAAAVAALCAATLTVATPAHAAFPGRNGLLVYADRNGQIYTVRTDGTHRTQITHGSVPRFSPQWSPDGQRIVFTQRLQRGQRLFVMNADGSGLHQLTRDVDGSFDFAGSFSPDGQKVLYTRCLPDQPCGIASVRANGTHRHFVIQPTDPDGFDGFSRYSPDGAWISYDCQFQDGYRSRICLVRPNGSGAHAITRPALEAARAEWAPDGSRLTFMTFAFGASETVDTIRPDGTDLRQLTPTLPNLRSDWLPVWSPDGKKILFTSDRNYPLDHGFSGGGDFFIMNADGTNQHLAVKGSLDHPLFACSWQPLP